MIKFSPNNSETFLSNLGTFWSQTFAAHDQAISLVNANLMENEQLMLDTANAVAALSRFDIPLFRRKLWYKLTLEKTTQDTYNLSYYNYDDGTAYSGEITYDQTKKLPIWKVPLPKGCAGISAIVNSPVVQGTILVRGIDFTIESGNLVLNRSPFDYFPTRIQSDSTGESTEVIDLWLFNSEFDLGYLYQQFGYAVSVYISSSSDAYRTLINAVWDTFLVGSNSAAFRAAIGAMWGLPVVGTAEETVEAILPRTDRLQIVTDKKVYEFHVDSTPNVEVGDKVYVGDFMVDSIQMFDGDSIEDLDISGVAIGKELLPFDLELDGNVVFSNQDLATSYSLDDDGVAVVQFPLGGRAADVAKFWDMVKSRGITSGQSVAQALRIIPGSGEPSEVNIPVTVNPMKFLLSKCLRNNTVVVVVKPDELDPLDGNRTVGLLRRLLPAHVMLVYAVELEMDVEYNTLSEEGVCDSLGFPDSTSSSYDVTGIIDGNYTLFLEN